MPSKGATVWKAVKFAVSHRDVLRSRTSLACCSHRLFTHTTRIIDLRSDTLTHPTDRMREAMRNAVVGDDVYGEDPTVNKLQAAVADILGKEAALLVPTCTMANTATVLALCDGRFNEIIVGESSHLFLYEVAAIAQLAGVQACCLPNLPDGTMDLAKMEAKVRPVDDDHVPLTRLISLENTHNVCGGKVLSLEYIRKVKLLAQKHNLLLHLDGARIFNAAVALKVPASEIAQNFDAVCVAFTKGLCCPVGSIIAGSRSFIDVARKARKALGGGMRQAGVLAAPMLVALEEMVPKLSEDHERAFRIALAVDAMKGSSVCSVDMDGVQSNIVMVRLEGKATPSQFSQRMQEVTDAEEKSLGQSVAVLMLPYTPTTVRYVTHHGITDDDVQKVIMKLQYIVEELSRS